MSLDTTQDHYNILALSHRRYDGALTVQDVKQAYRRALLRHHPDKAPETDAHPGRQLRPTHAQITVDAIALAYKTLSDPALKSDYDRNLRLAQTRGAAGSSNEDKVFHTGLDVVDLDDLEYDEATGVWWRGCRCGQERGYIVTEDELEKDARYGELITGCKGCSLWLKVLFQPEAECET
ncbi:Diphthamide biosynthesis protein 4 [Taxawa tesnikishii (nom. ined.)]|nr:Diphthamide biosynthesis protein 4 [Dothideales sp. JES 119]